MRLFNLVDVAPVNAPGSARERFVIGRKDGKREQLTGVDGCWRVKEM